MDSPGLALPIQLDDLRSTLKAAHIRGAQLFGSYARGDATSTSDLNLLIDPEPGVSLLNVIALQQKLETKTGVKVQLVTSIREPFARYIEPELVDIVPLASRSSYTP